MPIVNPKPRVIYQLYRCLTRYGLAPIANPKPRMIYQLCKQKPALFSLMSQPEEDEEEKFVDAHDEDDENAGNPRQSTDGV